MISISTFSCKDTEPEKVAIKDGVPSLNSPQAASLKQCVFSLVYMSHVIWFCLLHMRNNVFLGTLVPWLSDIYPNDDDKGENKISITVKHENFAT